MRSETKNNYLNRLLISSLIIILTISSLAGCKKLELNSHWREQDITIDGINEEWENATTYVDDDNVLIGIMNDEVYLYLSLMSNNRFMWR
jgi:hypothetical protein